MALWSIKKIQVPTPASSGELIGVNVTMIDKDTQTLAFEHVEITRQGSGGFLTEDLLDALTEDYTPNDFGL